MGCAPSSSSWGGAAGKGVDLDQTCVEVEELSARVAAARMRGARPRQEDVFVVRRGIQAAGNQCWLAVAVFDGHSGASSSNFAACHLWAEVGKQVEWARGDIKGALEQGFLATDKAMLNMGLRDGTTALVALASKEEVWVANCGDCRAVWCTRSGSTIALSTDHKPNMPSETVRIERAGGAVEYTPGRCPRVIAPGYSNLAMATSRSLGDFAFKRAPACEPAQQIVSAFPDVRRHPRKGKGGEILILCSDGVWDVMSSKDVCAYMREAVSKAGEGSNAKDLLEVVLVFLNMCIHKRGTQDNVTAIVVQFAPEEVPLGTKDSAEAEEEEGEECRGDGPNPLTDPIAIDTSVL